MENKEIKVGGFDGGPAVLRPDDTVTWVWPDGTKILCVNDDGVLVPVKLTSRETVIKEYDYQSRP